MSLELNLLGKPPSLYCSKKCRFSDAEPQGFVVSLTWGSIYARDLIIRKSENRHHRVAKYDTARGQHQILGGSLVVRPL